MAQTLVNAGLRAAGTGVRAGRRPYWNPYAVGVLLGLVLLATYAVTGRGLGRDRARSARWPRGLQDSDRPSTSRRTRCTRATGTTAHRSRRGRCSCCSAPSSARFALRARRAPRALERRARSARDRRPAARARVRRRLRRRVRRQDRQGLHQRPGADRRARSSTSAASCSCSPCSRRRTRLAYFVRKEWL